MAYRDYDYYMDTHRLRIAVSNMKNANTRERLDEIRTTCLQNIALLPPAPSAQMQVPPPKTELVRWAGLRCAGAMAWRAGVRAGRRAENWVLAGVGG